MKTFKILLAILTVTFLTTSVIVEVFSSLGEWVPCVPHPDMIELQYLEQDCISYVNVSITFATSGYNVSEWGEPIFDGNNISVDAKIWRWTGVSLPVIVTVKHLYNLGFLRPGEYNFTFKVWGISLKNMTFAARNRTNVSINPRSLNLWSKGRWISVHIEFLEGYSVQNINVTTILLNDTVPPDFKAPLIMGDYDKDGILDLTIKFDRQEVIAHILFDIDLEKLLGEKFMAITLTITGCFSNGAPFQGSTTMIIMLPLPRGIRLDQMFATPI